MKNEVVEAVSALIKEKGIDKKVFEEIITNVFLSMIKKKYNQNENFFVTFNVDKGDIEIQCNKLVVPDGEVTDEIVQISLTDALEHDPYVEVGEEIVILEKVKEAFGRRIIIAARQTLTQKLRELEKENLYQEYLKRVGEVITGEIHQISPRGDIRLNVDKTEVLLPKSEQVHSERYRRGDALKVIVLRVEKTNRDPNIIVSRKDVSLVRRLFELEVPEIYDGIVEIKSIARIPGERTKMAVISHDKRVDPVGACVGMKGVRIQSVVKDISHEKVDVVPWSSEIDTMIRRAMSPVIPLELIHLEGEGNRVMAVITDDQIAIAIGRKGQNIRLSSQLSGVQIEPVRKSDYVNPADEPDDELRFDEVKDLTAEQVTKLTEAGYANGNSVLNDSLDDMILKTGFEPEEAVAIRSTLSEYFEEGE